MGRDASFQISEITGLQALTGGGADFGAMGMKAPESPKASVNFDKAGPAVTTPGGPA